MQKSRILRAAVSSMTQSENDHNSLAKKSNLSISSELKFLDSKNSTTVTVIIEDL